MSLGNIKGIELDNIYEDKSMCMGKVDVCCPKCNTRLHVTRPDSEHPFWSLEKPRKDEGISNVVEQLLECKNPTCASKFTVYWYNE